MNKSDFDIFVLIGGMGSRLFDFKAKSSYIPKPLRKVKNKEIITYVFNNYLDSNFKNFILPLGYHSDYFFNYFLKKKKISNKKLLVTTNKDEYKINKNNSDGGIVNILLIKTAKKYNKSQRILSVLKKMNINNFSIAYGDGIGNININKIFNFHLRSKKPMTVACIKAKSQYGHFIKNIKSKNNISFIEKPILSDPINIGYFFCNKNTIKYFYNYADDDLENGIVKKIANNNNLSIFEHDGFWRSVDTLKDLKEINKLL